MNQASPNDRPPERRSRAGKVGQVTLKIDGNDVSIESGKTILEAAQQAEIEIPTLCYHKKLLPYGACRLCMVEITSDNYTQNANRKPQTAKMVAACAYPVEENLRVNTKSDKVIKFRKLMIELLMAIVPYLAYVRELAEEYDVKKSRFNPKLSMCILCGLCVRYCAEVKNKKTARPDGSSGGAVGFIGRGIDRELAWIPDSAYEKDCAGCFECFFICPTGVFPSNWSMNTIKQLRER